MNQTEKTKKFIIDYMHAFSGKPKPESLIRQYVADEKLIKHILFFEATFPEYSFVPIEIMAENDKVFMRGSVVGKHAGETEGIPATMKNIEAPFAVGYRIKNDKIVDFWAIADQMELLEQLGLHAEQVDVKPVESGMNRSSF